MKQGYVNGWDIRWVRPTAQSELLLFYVNSIFVNYGLFSVIALHRSSFPCPCAKQECLMELILTKFQP